jgi:hypothetical protein
MAIERTFHCDWRECERHVVTPGTHPPTFLTVAEDAGEELHFCSWDCILKHAAEIPPLEVIPANAA